MSPRSRKLRFAIILTMVSVTVAAEEITLEDAVALIMEHNPSVRSALLEVERARAAIDPVLSLSNSKLSVSGSYGATDGAERLQNVPSPQQEAGSFSGSVNLSVPVLPQLSFGAAVDKNGKGSVSVSITPFAPSSRTPAQTASYLKAVARYEAAVRETRAEAERAVLQSFVRERELTYAEHALELAERRYELSQELYRINEATMSEVQDAASALTAARRELYNAQKAVLEAHKSLKLMLGPDSPDVLVKAPDLDDVTEQIARLTEMIADYRAVEPYSTELRIALIELETLEAERASTPVWRPNLSISGKYGFPDGSFSLGAVLSFSPSDVKKEERAELELRTTEAREKLATERYLLSLESDLSLRTVEISRQALEAARIDLEKTELLLSETRLLLEHGERTVLELRQAELSAERARNQVFSQAVNLLSALSGYLGLYP